MDLLRVGRHLVHGAPVDQRDGRPADTARGPDTVHGRVAGTHDAHARPDRHRPALADAAQEGHPVDHVARIVARQPQRLGLLGADRDEDLPEPLAAEVVEHHVHAGALAVADLDAEALQDGEVLVDLRLRQPVGGDRPGHHAAGIRMRLEDRDADARAGQPLGGGQAGRPGADDRHPGVLRGTGRRRGREPGLLLLHDEALDLPDRQRLVQVGADAGVLAQVVADAAQDGGQRVVEAGDADRLPDVPGTHRGHVARHLLVHRALVQAGRGDAVEHVQRAGRLGPVHAERILAVAPVAADPVGVPAKVEQRAGRNVRAVAGEPGRLRLAADEVRRVGRPDLVVGGVHLLGVLEHPEVAARLQEVRAHGDGAHPRREQVGHVEAVGAAGERHREVAAELLGDPRGEVGRDRVERPARQVHARVAVEDGAPVVDLERVRELQAEGETAGGRRPLEVGEHGDRVGPFQVVRERLVGDRHVAEPQVVVDDAAHALGAEQGRVALDQGVEAALLEQVERDPLDLVGRAAVHGRERDRVGQAGGDVQVADRRVAPGDDVHGRRQVRRGIRHGVEIPLDVGLADAVQVVADAHVEDHPRTRAGPAQLVVQGVDQDPGPEILVEGLVDLELLRPLDVVPLVGDVDAGLVDVELVERLDGLELDQPRTHQPGRDDVLGHLRVGPGRHPERGLDLHPVLVAPEPMVGTRDEERRPRHVEERPLLLQLGEGPVGQLLHRDGMKPVRHRVPPRQRAR